MWKDTARSLPAQHPVVLVVLAVAALTLTAYPVTYGLSAPWWRSTFGRVLMLFTSVLALVVDTTLVTRILIRLHHSPSYEVTVLLQIITWGALASVGVAMWGWLLHVQFGLTWQRFALRRRTGKASA